MRLLLVEDDELLSSGLQGALRQAQYTVEHVGTGEADGTSRRSEVRIESEGLTIVIDGPSIVTRAGDVLTIEIE